MAVKSIRRRPIGTNPNTVVDPDAWVRPSDWLVLPTPTTHQMVGLFAVYNDDTQYLALSATAAGNYTVDWGDGTVDNWTSAAVASHTYNYTTLSSAVSSRGYKMAIVTVYPQSGTMTALVLTAVKHPSLVSTNTNYSYNWLDVWINGASLTTLTIGSATQALAPKMLEQVRIDAWAVTTYANQFYNCTELQSVILANSSGTVTSTNSMFYGCYALKTAPLFNTANVIDMSQMFYTCYSLKSTPLFNIASVTNMTSMFFSCYALPSVPLFNTASVNNMTSMFQACFTLTKISLYNTASVTNMTSMFQSCYGLTSVPLFNTANVTNMTSMFQYCYALQTVPLFNTTSVTNMTSMFNSCYALTSVPLFNTANVTIMTSMFNGCSSLATIPLFNTASLIAMPTMFVNCYNLNSIGAMDFSKSSSVTGTTSMFTATYQLSSANFISPALSFTLANSKLSATALNTVFTNLATKPAVATISSATGTGATATYTTSSPHGFKVAQSVAVAGLTPAAFNTAGASISAVNTSTTFLITSTATGTSSGVGTATIGTPIITVTGNPGAATCTTTIATAKGWTVTV
jgi:hypothetical protein